MRLLTKILLVFLRPTNKRVLEGAQNKLSSGINLLALFAFTGDP